MTERTIAEWSDVISRLPVVYPVRRALEERFWKEFLPQVDIVSVRTGARSTLFVQIEGGGGITNGIPIRHGTIVGKASSSRDYFRVLHTLPPQTIHLSEQLIADIEALQP